MFFSPGKIRPLRGAKSNGREPAEHKQNLVLTSSSGQTANKFIKEEIESM
jgi:hypothetical protein